MHALVFLAPFVALAVALRHTPGRALLAIYLPALLLMPESFRAVTAGIPKANFNQAIIVALLPLALFRYGKQWRLTFTDALVIALALVMGYSEYSAAGYKEAQNLLFAMIASVVAPYLVARLVIQAEQLDVAFARRFVILVFAVALISTFEFKFGWNPFLVLPQVIFPGQGSGWITTFRYGFARIAGPYSHAILAGVMLVVAYRLQRWLEWGGHWERRFAFFPSLPWSKGRVITAILVLGALMTFVRGPWLGGILGAAAVIIGRSSNRKAMLTIVGVSLMALLPLGYLFLMAYLDIQPGIAMTQSQESALYRKVLVERYLDIALDHAWFGWGKNTWPRVAGMASIDNYFLLLSLMHGVVASLLLAGLFLWQGTRLFRRGMSEPLGSNSLAFTFAGILIAIFVSLGTVYLGEQVMPMLFLILGWSESHLTSPVMATQAKMVDSASPSLRRGFRVIR